MTVEDRALEVSWISHETRAGLESAYLVSEHISIRFSLPTIKNVPRHEFVFLELVVLRDVTHTDTPMRTHTRNNDMRESRKSRFATRKRNETF